jgi:hypothetical protein
MGAQAAAEHRAAIQQQVLRREGRSHSRPRGTHEFGAGSGRDVLEHDAKARMARHERR